MGGCYVFSFFFEIGKNEYRGEVGYNFGVTNTSVLCWDDAPYVNSGLYESSSLLLYYRQRARLKLSRNLQPHVGKFLSLV